jgi:rhamnosyltransferase
MQHVYILGSKSIGQYGGYESFVMNLLQQHEDNTSIKYHVACKKNGSGYMDLDKLAGITMINDNEFSYCNAHCFLIHIPEKLGSAQAIYYDIKALRWSCEHIEKNHIEHPIVYILASRIGPFEKKYVERIHNAGGRVYQNPDGHENWRAKWSPMIRKYWKFSEQYAVKNADLVVCDSKSIENYIQDEYSQYHPKTTFIAYGSHIKPSPLKDDDPKYVNWLSDHNLVDRKFYTVVGRCVPENNFETIIREFMLSHSDKDLAIITTDNPKMLDEMEQKLHYRKDKRIKFVGTVYDTELLTKIRENAYGYFHGHSVGGTNPSLLEALGATKLNLLYDVGFNREVAEDAAFYWTLDEGNLAKLIDAADRLSIEAVNEKGDKAKQRIVTAYSWKMIADKYEKVFNSWRGFV